MNKVVARHDTLAYQIDFPSPVYTSAIVGKREDIAVGVGGGKRFGMPNIVIAIEKAADPKLCWNVCSWLDLGDDVPWCGAKVPMSYPEEGSHKQFLAMGHLDAVSIIEYEENTNFDPKKLAAEEEERKNAPEDKSRGKRDAPPAPKNAPVFLRRAARLGLKTDADDPDKKVVCALRSVEPPKRLSDQLFFVCQDDSSVVMFRLKKKAAAGGSAKQQQPKKKVVGEDGEEAATTTAPEEEECGYEVYSHIIPSNELRMGSAHPTDMDACETPAGIVLMVVCDDKKVRAALLPQAWHCLKVCKAPELLDPSKGEEGMREAAANNKAGTTNTTITSPTQQLSPLSVVVRSLLVLTPEDLNIPFNVMRSTLRVGMLIDAPKLEGRTTGVPQKTATTEAQKKDAKKEGGAAASSSSLSASAPSLPTENVTLFVLAYDSKNTSTNSVMGTLAIVDGCFLTLAGTPTVTPVCKGAVTNIMPLYDTIPTGTRKPMPERWLATTVEGTIVELVQQQQNDEKKNKKSSGTTVSSSLSSANADGDDVTVFPTYSTLHQRPYKPKRSPPPLAAVHQEPISSAAISLQSGLLVTVDIAQKARLSRIEDLFTIPGNEENIPTNGAKKANAKNNKEKKKPLNDGIPLLFPKKLNGNGGGSGSLLASPFFAPFFVILIALIGSVIAVMPEVLPPALAEMINGLIGNYIEGGRHQQPTMKMTPGF